MFGSLDGLNIDNLKSVIVPDDLQHYMRPNQTV